MQKKLFRNARRLNSTDMFDLRAILLSIALTAGAGLMPALAGQVRVVDVEADLAGSDTWRFSVTLRHGDTGWEHYADEWRVLAPDGTVLGVRTLLHPHVNEQPFTRSLSGVRIPPNLTYVLIDARDNEHGRSQPVRVELRR